MLSFIGNLPSSAKTGIFIVLRWVPRICLHIFIWRFSKLSLKIESMLFNDPYILFPQDSQAYNIIGLISASNVLARGVYFSV